MYQQHRHHNDHLDAVVDHTSPFSPSNRANCAWFDTPEAHGPQLQGPSATLARQQRPPTGR
jgi:hypothetical protein